MGWERVGTAFPHLLHVLFQNEFKAALKWLFFGCAYSHLFLLALGVRNLRKVSITI